MAINKNHEFEELDGVKCSIVEKNATKERVDFLKPLLEFNHYTVIVVASPPPKVAAAPQPKPQPQPQTNPESSPTVPPPVVVDGNAVTPDPQPQPQPNPNPQIQPEPVPPATQPEPQPQPAAPESFTIGVTDVSFNPTNAIFGRLLRTKEGNVVTLAYWQQKEPVSHDEVPYFEKQTD